MLDENYKPDGTGVVMGDDRPIPNRGTGCGSVGMGAPYGAAIDISSTNSLGSIHDACLSDPVEKDRADDQRWNPGDKRGAHGGTGIGSATGSDPIDLERNNSPRGG